MDVPLDVYGAVTSASFGAFCFGYHMAVMNGPLDVISEQMQFNSKSLLKGFVVSSLLLGALLGSLSAGKYADLYGRKIALLYNSILLIVGAAGASLAVFPWMLILSRFICGFGVGMCSVLVPVFISEVSPDHYKGSFGTLNQLFICIGIFAALIMSLPITTSAAYWWRLMFAFGIIPAAAHAAGILRYSTALKTLEPPSEEMQKSMCSSDLESRASGATLSISEALQSPTHSALVLSGCSLFALQQFSGVNAVVFYSSNIFRSAGVESEIWASVAVAFVNIIGTAISSCIIHRFARKTLLIGSFSGMGLSLLLLVHASSSNSNAGQLSPTLSVLGTVTYIISFSFGCGPIPSLLLPEILPLSVRASGTSLSLGTHWACNFVIGLLFLRVTEAIGISLTYFGFSVVCFTACLFIQNNSSFKSNRVVT